MINIYLSKYKIKYLSKYKILKDKDTNKYDKSFQNWFQAMYN